MSSGGYPFPAAAPNTNALKPRRASGGMPLSGLWLLFLKDLSPPARCEDIHPMTITQEVLGLPPHIETTTGQMLTDPIHGRIAHQVLTVVTTRHGIAPTRGRHPARLGRMGELSRCLPHPRSSLAIEVIGLYPFKVQNLHRLKGMEIECGVFVTTPHPKERHAVVHRLILLGVIAIARIKVPVKTAMAVSIKIPTDLHIVRLIPFDQRLVVTLLGAQLVRMALYQVPGQAVQRWLHARERDRVRHLARHRVHAPDGSAVSSVADDRFLMQTRTSLVVDDAQNRDPILARPSLPVVNLPRAMSLRQLPQS
ncbi:hypothetical protein B0H16DRAFT_1722687 [Mycena metata]|uniref:Uncharacterized protein n=1 Tax=Mycena metata TaxID=1033252 RepID=A0AAD7NCI4_9AGAR|nr:hypothetical protein B0H16DRAFT_1722687 [Mycena metata]